MILRSARAVFAEHDYHGTSIDRVARQAGVARQLVYSLFGGKDELFIAVVDDSCRSAIDQVTEQMLVSGPSAAPRELIGACVRALFEFIGNRPEDAAILRIAEYGGFGPAKSEVVMARRRIEEGLAETFSVAWQGSSELAPQAARLLALLALSMVEAVGFRQPSEPEWDADATVKFLTEFLLGGMLRLDFRRGEIESFGTA